MDTARRKPRREFALYALRIGIDSAAMTTDNRTRFRMKCGYRYSLNGS